MKYIDWYCEKTQNKNTAKKTQDQKHSGFRYWEDLVTETKYYISDTDYDRIYQTGKEMLDKHIANNNLEAIEEIFYHSGGEKDLDLFPDLPYLPDSCEITARCTLHMFSDSMPVCDQIRFSQNARPNGAENAKRADPSPGIHLEDNRSCRRNT